MELQIIGAGFCRTSTTSLMEALNQLGYQTHHMKRVFADGEIKKWAEFGDTYNKNNKTIVNEEEGKKLKDLLKNYTASCDFPSCAYYKELMTYYPDAKVILTIRDGEAWYKSCSETVFGIQKFVLENTYVLHYFPNYLPIVSLLNKVWINHTFGELKNCLNKDFCIKVFNDRNEEVKRLVPKDKLLVFEPKMGWKPLCEFLGKPIPDTPYPNANDTAEFKSRMVPIVRGFYVVDRLLALSIVGGIGYVGFTAFNKFLR